MLCCNVHFSGAKVECVCVWHCSGSNDAAMGAMRQVTPQPTVASCQRSVSVRLGCSCTRPPHHSTPPAHIPHPNAAEAPTLVSPAALVLSRDANSRSCNSVTSIPAVQHGALGEL